MPDQPSDSPETPPQAAPRFSPLSLFVQFASLSLVGFGGVMPWARRSLVEERKMLTAEEFAALLAFAQLLPGPTICNLAIIFGHRRGGTPGACAALCGLVLPPSLFVLGLGYLHLWLGDHPVIQDAIRGMSVVTAALVASTALQMARALPLAVKPLLFALAMFAGVGLMHWPLVAVMAVLAALSLAVGWREAKP